MARQEINIGTAPTGAGGDTTRSTAVKINAMTQELYARNTQLGTASNADIGTAVGNVMPVGAGGWLGESIIESSNANNARRTGLHSWLNTYNAPHGALQVLSSDWGNDPRWQSQLALGISENRVFSRSIQKDQSAATSWVEHYHTGNTTRAADGTLKAI